MEKVSTVNFDDDYIKNEIQTEILSQLLAVDKVPFTNGGIAIMENIVA